MHRSPEEKQLLERAARVLPQGSLGNIPGQDEYSFIVRRGLGSHIWDISGNEYVDYLLGSGPMILGHAHPKIVAAVQESIEKGSTFFTQNEYAIALAEQIVSSVACADQVRFTSSGTEATLQCIRLARAYRKRDKILKFEGGFHGMHDYAVMSFAPKDTVPFPYAVANSAGIPKAIADTVLIAPFNDLDTACQIIEQYQDELAGVIMEPLQRIFTPVPGFLEGIRELTNRHQIPLIFDEVVTGFRLAYGGAQEFYGVTPDLAALGKIVGGGFPLAAVAGRRELMEAYDSSVSGDGNFVPQIGTLSGNPIAAAAGLETLKILKEEDRYTEYHAAGADLKNSLARMLNEAEIPAHVIGSDIMFDVYFMESEPHNYRAAMGRNQALNRVFDNALQDRGVYKSPGKFYVGMCHTLEDRENTKDAFKAAVAAVRDSH